MFLRASLCPKDDSERGDYFARRAERRGHRGENRPQVEDRTVPKLNDFVVNTTHDGICVGGEMLLPVESRLRIKTFAIDPHQRVAFGS